MGDQCRSAFVGFLCLAPQELSRLIPDYLLRRKFLPEGTQGYDFMILSDLLHFHSSHDNLLSSIKSLLSRSNDSRVHVSAGNYTRPDVCYNFFSKCGDVGLVFDEVVASPSEEQWKGEMSVNGLTIDALTLRKSACRYWVGRWSQGFLLADS